MSDKEIRVVEVLTCMVCNAPGKTIYSDLEDWNYGHSSGWKISQCSNNSCGLLWLNPMPSKEDIGKAYESYYTHEEDRIAIEEISFTQKAYLSFRYGYYTQFSFVAKIWGMLVSLIPLIKNKYDSSIMYLPYVNGGKVLDFGCGNGSTLDNLKRIGWDCYGLDFDPKAVQYCQSKGLRVALGEISKQNYPDNYFDAITINHVIEHVHEVDSLLKDCYAKLKPGGILSIATPNTDNWQHSFYKEFWFQLDAPRHLHIFNIDNLETVVRRNKFSVTRSFSSVRMDAWSTIVTRSVKRKGRFEIGKDKKNRMDLVIGLVHQQISVLLTFFNKKSAGEIILIAKK